MSEKKRETTRVQFHTRAELQVDEKTISGEVNNLSLTGMFLITDTSEIGEIEGREVTVTVSLAGVASNLRVTLEGKVVRKNKEGIGIEFTEMEFDSFVHLRNIVAYNTGDDERVMEEFNNTFEE